MQLIEKIKNQPNIVLFLWFIFIALLISLIVLLVLKLVKKSPGPTKNNDWQIDYLNKVYPLAKGKFNVDGPILFNDLEFIFTNLLPADVIDEYKKISYKADVPGPSCQERPCKCVTGPSGEKVPNVRFDPDPIWDNQWPPCIFGNNYNSYGTAGLFNWDPTNMISNVAGPCCSSVENAQNCILAMKDAYKWVPSQNPTPANPGYFECSDPKSNVCGQLQNQSWLSYGVWGGDTSSRLYNPPKLNQYWKPTLHSEYCAVKSKFDEKDWSNFYNIKGDKPNSWVEVVHTFFPSEEEGGDGGAWFYRAKGSGIFLNMGATIIARNKFEMLVKFMGSSVNVTKTDIVFDEDVGLNAVVDTLLTNDYVDNITYWQGNLVNVAVSYPLWQKYAGQIPGTTGKEKFKNFVKGIYDPSTLIKNPSTHADYLFLYEINRVANTGGIDGLIISSYQTYQNLHKQIGKSSQLARTLQFTAQPNIYMGWTTEILYLGDNYPLQAISNIKDVPKNQLRVLDPTDIPSDGNSISSSGKSCDFKYPLRFGYCDILKDTWLDPKIGADIDVTTSEYTECSEIPNQP